MTPEDLTTLSSLKYLTELDLNLDEDLKMVDAEGNPITEGVVSVALNDVLQKVDPKYADVSMWKGDYTMNLE